MQKQSPLTMAKHINIDRTVKITLLLLMGVSVIATMALGLSHVSKAGIMSIAFNWMAMVMLMIIFRNCCQGRKQNNTHEIKGMTITLFLCVMCDSVVWLLDGLADYRVLNYLCNIGADCTMLLASYLYFLFVLKSDKIDSNLFPWMKGFLRTATIVSITLEILNPIGGYFYTINEAGVYIRGPFGGILAYLQYIVVLGGSVLFIVRQKIDWRTRISYLAYCIVPSVCSVWFMLTGYPPTFFVSATFTMLLIHGDLYIVQGKEAAMLELDNAKKEAEYELSQQKLMLTQIKPHFMYNVLGNIEVLCKVDPEKAGRAIHHFTHYLRSNMDIVKNEETIPFSKELEHIRNYVWLEQMRFEEELEYKEEIEVTDFRVPQLAIQPMVENAIKHGMMGDEDGILRVTLKTRETDEEYIINICDDGCGFDPTQTLPNDGRSHIGIQSAEYGLRMRVNGVLNIESRIGEGTTVTIRIPKTKGEITNDHPCGG